MEPTDSNPPSRITAGDRRDGPKVGQPAGSPGLADCPGAYSFPPLHPVGRCPCRLATAPVAGTNRAGRRPRLAGHGPTHRMVWRVTEAPPSDTSRGDATGRPCRLHRRVTAPSIASHPCRATSRRVDTPDFGKSRVPRSGPASRHLGGSRCQTVALPKGARDEQTPQTVARGCGHRRAQRVRCPLRGAAGRDVRVLARVRVGVCPEPADEPACAGCGTTASGSRYAAPAAPGLTIALPKFPSGAVERWSLRAVRNRDRGYVTMRGSTHGG